MPACIQERGRRLYSRIVRLRGRTIFHLHARKLAQWSAFQFPWSTAAVSRRDDSTAPRRDQPSKRLS